MAEKIKRCLIVSGAPEDDIEYYKDYLSDSYIICADSGYSKLSLLNIVPDLVIGDFDSSEFPESFQGEVIKLNTRKNDSDTFHSVKEAIKRGYNNIIILGGIGSRVDHSYANILCLIYCFKRNVDCRLINKNNYITVKTGKFTIKKGRYENFSMFALFEKCCGLTIKGSQYDLINYELMPESQLNLSNSFKEETVNVSIDSGKILLIMSND